MDLRQLRCFVAVAEERSFTRAAERLHIAQPPLSRHIQHLEDEIGSQLIDRTARPLRLTTIGRLVFEQSRQILDQISGMRDMVRRAVAAERRHFAIGFVASTIYARLPALIRGYRAAAQEIDLSLVELVSLDQIAALKDGRIDVGFGRIRFEDPAIQRIVLREERLVVALPSSHRLARSEVPIRLSLLADDPLIIYPRQPRPSYADQVLGLFADRGLSTRVAHEARELQIAIGLTAAEEGICIVPESVGKSHVDGVVYHELADVMTSPIIMSYRAHDRSAELALMASLIEQTYAEWNYDVPLAIRTLARTNPD